MIIEQFRISGNEDGFYDRFLVVHDNADVSEWIAIAKKINRISKVDAVINFHENRQLEASRIAEELNLPYHSADECMISKDKVFMRRFLNDNSFDSIKGDNIDKVIDYLKKDMVRFPIIIKPRFGWGSKFIKKVTNYDELNSVLQFINDSKDGVEFCFEEFINGTEYSVESFSQNGIHKIVTITEKKKDENFIETGQIVPAKLSDNMYKIVYEKIKLFLSLINHKNGPMHTEIIINNSVHIVETHLRMGGDKIPELIEFQSDFNLLKCWCDLIIGKKVIDLVPELRYQDTRTHIDFVHGSKHTSGKLFKSIVLNEKIKHFLKEEVAYLKQGDIIPLTVDSFSRVGHYIYRCSDEDYLTIKELNPEEFILF